MGGKQPVSFQQTSTLCPNPANGRFSIKFTEALANATVYITDVQQAKGNDYQIDFNIASLALVLFRNNRGC